jgi:hypothetical protein
MVQYFSPYARIYSQTVLLTPQKDGSGPFHDPRKQAPQGQGQSAGNDGPMPASAGFTDAFSRRMGSPTRRPRFRRAPRPPAFRVTDEDVAIVRRLARHRFLRSTHVAALVARSLDRTNYRLCRLFHPGYVDRPHAQFDRFPFAGSSHLVYPEPRSGSDPHYRAPHNEGLVFYRPTTYCISIAGRIP